MDEFNDDDFDDLNDTTLQELENNAIQFTQAQRKQDSQSQTLPPHHDPSQVENYDDLEFEDDDLDDAEVTNELLPPVTRPSVDKTISQQQQQQQQHQHPPQPLAARHPPLPPQQRWNPPPAHANPPTLSSRPRYPPPVPTYNASVASQRFQPAHPAAPYRPLPSQFVRPAPPSSARFNPPQSQSQLHAAPGNDVIAALQQRLRALESELNSARGEASIIRTNSTKAEQDHAAEVARLKKQNAEQAARQERAVEAAIAAERQATTELQFLQRDMKDASTRPRRRENAPVSAAPATTTPKKAAKTWGVADGFDDMDIAPSPTKNRGKTRDPGPVAIPLSERTPTKGKRKRPPVDSPVMALETDAQDVIMVDDTGTTAIPVQYPGPAPTTLPFEFLQVILDHGSLHGEPPTFDILSRYAYPSDPTTSFASFIFQHLPLMGTPLNPVQLLVDFARLVIQMWSQCLRENFLRPIWDLASLLSFTLQLQTISVVPQIVSDLVPTLQQSIYLVAEARFKSQDGDVSAGAATETLQQHVDTTYILSLLNASAAACATTMLEADGGAQTRQAEFWQLITLDLVLILLTPKQQLDDIIGMLDMLCTSTLPDSLGPIIPGKDADLAARMIIDKVSLNLVDLPRAVSSVSQKHAVRFAVLRTLMAFTRTPYGARQVAGHVSVIPRLVTALGELVDVLYDLSDPVVDTSSGGLSPSHMNLAVGTTPDDRRDGVNDLDDGRSGVSLLVSQIILLLHTMVTDPQTANVANILSKLSMSHGGSQRYILSLSRLNFAEEDLVYESAMDADTVDRAHELLEIAVTPDEGDSIAISFGV
ncbi:DNA repair protein Rad26 [Colletotrichum abscissum]|uniref:DNA repair protein Rad26 n=1 Tax=Colletotrichum abscissum TaxID=1671311 RepID=A0A9P9X3M8_9PEZI|nr:DNA repair protein Rad26 [Colletotrichum abscissum]KAI3534961.1 DNA repair protein Rad26 [Colletotrichum abscissum]KAK1473148.1 DNA repair protein Rad26 [Colletotrichum abscissum]